MWCLIAAESAIFSIFVVAYLYYAGKSISGPTPREVLQIPYLQLHLPILQQLHYRAGQSTLSNAARQSCSRYGGCYHRHWARSFILGTAREWYTLDLSTMGVTISSSLFGTTFYSLVGLHLPRFNWFDGLVDHDDLRPLLG